MQKRGTDRAITAAQNAVEKARRTLTMRSDGLTGDEIRKRGSRYAEEVRKHRARYAAEDQERSSRYTGEMRQVMERRVRSRRRPRWPIGVVLLGLAASFGYLLYDKGRRDAMKERVGRLQKGALQGYTDLGGVRGAVGKVKGRVSSGSPDQETLLDKHVREAISSGGEMPPTMEAAVEGRTVTPRGEVDDPSWADAAAERIQQVDGIVAVVNLTTSQPPTA